VGTKTKEELASGIQVTFSGTGLTPAYNDYFKRLKDQGLRGAATYEPISSKDKDAGRCWAVMGSRGIAGWVDSIERGDLELRTVGIIIVPKGVSPIIPPGRLIPSGEEYSVRVKKLADWIQTIRMDIATKVQNSIYRNDTLSIITPTDFELLLPKNIVPNSNIIIRAKFTSWTDRPITGTVLLTLPTDWKALSKPVSIKTTGYGKSADAEFKVRVPKSTDSKSIINAIATLDVQGVQFKVQTKTESKLD
jgi:hypothetical protein